MRATASSLFPRLISQLSRPFEKKLGPDFRTLSDLTDEVEKIEKVLKQYALDFPFFVEIGSAPIPVESDEFELWAFERVGWGKLNGEFRLLYVLEGLPIPIMEDAEVVGIHCLSTPPLEQAAPFENEVPLQPEEVRAVALATGSPEVKEGSFAFIPLFLSELSRTVSDMNKYQLEFDRYLEARISEAVAESPSMSKAKRKEVEAYFRCERRQEFFDQFLDGSDSQTDRGAHS